MIHLVEGPNGTGKTTFAGRLSGILDAPMVEDYHRQEMLREGFSIEDCARVQIGYTRMMDAVNRPGTHLVMDRGWVSAIAYARMFPGRKPLPSQLAVLARAALREGTTIWAVWASPATVSGRLLQRGESADDLSLEFETFHRLFNELEDAGFTVVRVQGQ